MRAVSDFTKRNDDEIDLRQVLASLRRKWHYFLLSGLLLSLAAFLYIHFTLPVYEATSSVLIKDSKNKTQNIEDILTGDLFGNVRNIATEIGILRSRSVLEETITELNLNIGYYGKSALFTHPLYKTAPFIVNPVSISPGIYDEEFSIVPLGSNKYRLNIECDNAQLKDYHHTGEYRYGETVKTPWFSIVLEANTDSSSEEYDEYFFVIHSMNRLVKNYNERMQAEPLNKDATIVQVRIQDNIPDRAVDFLNTLGKVYINRDVKDKSSVAGLTLKFIDEQLGEISKQLNETEVELQRFKEEKGTVDLGEEAKAYLERVTAIDEHRLKAEIELRSLDKLYDYVSQNRDLEELAPSGLGTPDPLLVELMTTLKELQSRRKTLAYGSSPSSPAVRVIDEQIAEARKTIVENINSSRRLTQTNLQSIKDQMKEYDHTIRQIPNIERELLGIQRNFAVNENIYLYLLQKKAETGIAKATAVSDNKVLDVASVADRPVIPNTKAVIILTALLALVLPVIIIIVQGFIRNTISNREDIEKLTRIPIIGVVGHLSSGERLVVSSKPKSSIAEAFRSIRANLMFFGLADQHKVVLITSSVGGEGKSFSTLNLAAVLSLQNHKVIIVGMDLRKPQLVQDLGVENTTGVSTYLIGKNPLDSIIQKSNIEGLDIIPSGPVPPNPAELLAKKETVTLLDELRRRYDYIIIDTPPVGIVSDAMMLMNMADINVFILRENYSKKEYIKTINNYYAQGKMNNLCIVLNDAGTHQRYGYGYGYSYGYYGYGYYDDEHRKKKFFQRIFSRA